jgi:hypothetical protein
MPCRLSFSIVAACLGVTGLALTGTARADDRPEGRESASRWAFEHALVAGYGHGRAIADYRYFDDDPALEGGQDRATGHASTAAFDLAVSARVGGGLLLGGFVRAGAALLPSPFTGDSELWPLILMGPRVAWAPAAFGGLELRAGGGLALLWRPFGGGSATIGIGYPMGELAGGTVMLGVEGSGVWVRAGEDADRGRYTYRDRLLGAHLVLGLRR